MNNPINIRNMELIPDRMWLKRQSNRNDCSIKYRRNAESTGGEAAIGSVGGFEQVLKGVSPGAVSARRPDESECFRRHPVNLDE